MWLACAGAGAATAYLFDPSSGNRRRRRVADAIVHYSNESGDAAATAARDLRNRTRGIVAELQRKVRSIPADDRVLQERVRAAIGRVISQPHAVAVTARGGHVTLSGSVMGAEEHRLVSNVLAVDGVKNVEARFGRHQRPAGVLSLQGGRWRPSWPVPFDIPQRSWEPSTRTIAASAGTALVAVALARRGKSGAWLATAGGALFLRALTNLDFRRLVGLGAGRHAIHVQKTITVDAPVDQVFAFWDDFANFPRFMRHVRDVQPTRDPRTWRWSVSGAPTAAAPIEYHAVVTERVLNRVLAWKTTEDSAVGHAGVIRFEPVDDARTRIHIRLAYNPPDGALAHGVLALFGADPKSRLDEDMVRMKTVLETGSQRLRVRS